MIAGGLAVGAALLISTRLGLATQGLVATSISVLAGLSVLTGAGFTHAVAFAVARKPSAAGIVADQAAALAIGGAALGGALAAGIGSWALPAAPVLWWHVAIALPFFQLGQLGLGLQQGLGSSRGYVTTYIAQPLTAFLLAVLAGVAVTGRPDEPSRWAGTFIVLPFIIQAATVIAAWRALPREDAAQPMRRMLSYTARIYPSTLAHYLSYRLDLILIGSVLGAVPAGLYSLALNGVDAVVRIGQTVATLLYPRFAVSNSTEPSPALARRATLLSAALSFVAMGTLAVITLALGRIAGPSVTTVGVLLGLMSLGGAGIGAWGVSASYLAAQDRLGAILRVNAALLATSLVFYFGLIPVIGVYGGAIGTSAGLVVASILGLREIGRPHEH